MAYGVVPLASTVSCIPQILGETGSGLALPAKDTDAYVKGNFWVILKTTLGNKLAKCYYGGT